MDLGIDDLAPAPYNPREITEAAAKGLRASVERFGDVGGITYNERTKQLVTGHQRVAALRALGAAMVDGALQLPSGHRFAVRVVDWNEIEEKAANIEANNSHIAGSFTAELDALLHDVRSDLGDESFAELSLDALLSTPVVGEDDPYTQKIDSPIYEPTGPCPEAADLCKPGKTDELLAAISAAEDIPGDVRAFLERAAQRHTVFDYQKIAEFYAHAGPEVQRLMESSALVIIDVDAAIEGGFATLTGELVDAYTEGRGHE